MKSNKVLDAIMGVAIGDAVGVPFEFRSREDMEENPATDMTGYGTYNQPHGTWSDDSSLTFCLAQSLVQGYDIKDMAEKFIKWRDEAYWTAHNEVFDIGKTTSIAISRLKRIIKEDHLDELTRQKEQGSPQDNGNGSLMRIIPLLFYVRGRPIEERKHFNKLIQNDILDTPKEQLLSGGYVIEVLESSIWFFLQTDNYRDSILGIINLGHDTDTSAAITGGLSGLYYGIDGIPGYWVNTIARKKDIIKLCEDLNQKL